ncbi:MAG: hypothetical protein H6566_16770 [Lewinellaceae bacterium]|nr:hypothetical protein [Lewinellaceae bacterium]
MLFLLSCSRPREREVYPAFYHWQTRLELSPGERTLADSLGARRLYVKFFDVDWDGAFGEPAPLAEVQLAPATYTGLEVVPAVFITNRSLEQLPMEGVARLAANIIDHIFVLAEADSSLQLREIQLDCDWTAGTREVYFQLLRLMGEKLEARGVSLSATIRLHQLRYPERTGVPPVKRGMLMFYNMGSLEDWAEPNSILNLKKAEPYLQGFADYPLPLDLALPLFHWGVLYREGRMIRLINNLEEGQLADRARFQLLGPGRYQVVQGTFLDGYYLYEGDLIRLESVDAGLLQQAARRLQRLPWGPEMTLAFYHLDSTAVRAFKIADLAQLEEAFR